MISSSNKQETLCGRLWATIYKGAFHAKSDNKNHTRRQTLHGHCGFFLSGSGLYKTGALRLWRNSGHGDDLKLSSELSKRDTGRTLYILDEPTTGLHFEDIRLLLDVLNKLVDRGNTVIVIEHNLDVIKVADHIIDIGPEGGAAGGEIVAAGTPHEIACAPRSYTGEFLKKLGL